MKARLANVYKKLKQEKIDALLLNKVTNISYLSGFQGSEAWALVSKSGANFLITSLKYDEAAEDEVTGFKIKLRNGSICSILRKLCGKLKIKRLGFEASWLSYEDHVKLRRELAGFELVPSADLVEAIREIKEPGELRLLNKAIQISDRTHKLVLEFVKPGRSEEELAIEIDYALRMYGAEAPSFPTIVTSGERTSLPHGRPTRKKFGSCDPVLLDFGASYKGYQSDLTRMVFLGRMSQKFKKIYGWLLLAQARAIKKMRPGAVISDVDRAARRYLDEKGLGRYFLHGLGHGVGREIHERPQLTQTTNGRLKEGMVITAEPAIYIPGWGGLRVEDVVLVRKSGPEILSQAPREIINIR